MKKIEVHAGVGLKCFVEQKFQPDFYWVNTRLRGTKIESFCKSDAELNEQSKESKIFKFLVPWVSVYL